MVTSTVEDYIKQIYLEQIESADGPVSMGRVANSLGVVPGTATTMVKSLADSELLNYEPRVGVRLTEAGEELALQMLRRHRLIELFLVEKLGLDWSEIHEEAEKLEHAISDRVLEKIDALLGHPKVDPHGDPIPTESGNLNKEQLKNLCNCELNQPLHIARITDQSPVFLQFINKSGLMPGVKLTVQEREPAAYAITLQFANGKSLIVGSPAGEKILVE